MSSAFRSDLLTRVGVQMTASSVRRYEMLPPLPSTYERCHSFWPTAQISSLIFLASGELSRATHLELLAAPALAGETAAAGAVDVVISMPALEAASRAD